MLITDKTITKTKKSASGLNLIIVESPTKAKTISGMLGADFRIESSFGHIRDLPKSKIGIDIEKNFEPQYIIPLKSKKRVSELKKLAEKSEKIILATDEDREGEAIAWHIAQILNLDKTKNSERIVFHEITKKAVEDALNKPRALDLNLVDAQQARRVLDRLVGYKLSPFLWKKVMPRLSAGRVQSVALRLIVDREKEIKNFKPQKYFTIEAILKEPKKNEEFFSLLISVNKKQIPKPGITEKKQAENILEELEKAKWNVFSVKTGVRTKNPYPPFTTSTLQQAAWNFYKFSAKKTMVLAQKLYEGIEIKEKGRFGLITYMRTDSLNLSEDALSAAHDFILKNFGAPYATEKPRRFKTKSKGAQEAHEAIRPTDAWLSPEKIKNDLAPDEYKLYKLIWQRFVASQMKEAMFHETEAKILADASRGENSYLFESKGVSIKFDGFLKVYPIKFEESTLPVLEKNQKLSPVIIENKEHETKPPPRYNEASLVKALEKYGIGRPSTYAPTISTIQERGYVIKNSGKALEPTEIGIKVTDLLTEHFSEIVDINFTAKIEEDFDEIASGKKNWQPVIREFYEPFNEKLETKYKEVKEQKAVPEETDEVCEKCGKKMLIKLGRFGKFLACSGFPDCKNAKPLPKEPLNIKCPKCKEGDVVERKTKKGKRTFYGCSRYPSCDFASWEKPKEGL